MLCVTERPISVKLRTFWKYKLKPSSNLIAGLPKATPLVWFFCDFRCGALLFICILVIFKYKIGKNRR